MSGQDVSGRPAPEGAAEARVLLVGHLGAPGTPDLNDRFGADMVVVDYTAVTAALLKEFDPHFVVSPIVTPAFDIMDLGLRLWQLGYKGAYRALTEVPLPNPELVLREVRALCPALNVDILCIDLGRTRDA